MVERVRGGDRPEIHRHPRDRRHELRRRHDHTVPHIHRAAVELLPLSRRRTIPTLAEDAVPARVDPTGINCTVGMDRKVASVAASTMLDACLRAQ